MVDWLKYIGCQLEFVLIQFNIFLQCQFVLQIAIMESKDNAQPPNYFLSPDMLSITSIRLNGSNYAQQAQTVEVSLLARKKFDYVIKEPPVPTDPKFADWKVEDAQIRSCLWNSMESKISCSLVFFPTAKLVWEQASSQLHKTKFLLAEMSTMEEKKSVHTSSTHMIQAYFSSLLLTV